MPYHKQTDIHRNQTFEKIKALIECGYKHAPDDTTYFLYVLCSRVGQWSYNRLHKVWAAILDNLPESSAKLEMAAMLMYSYGQLRGIREARETLRIKSYLHSIKTGLGR